MVYHLARSSNLMRLKFFFVCRKLKPHNDNFSFSLDPTWYKNWSVAETDKFRVSAGLPKIRFLVTRRLICDEKHGKHLLTINFNFIGKIKKKNCYPVTLLLQKGRFQDIKEFVIVMCKRLSCCVKKYIVLRNGAIRKVWRSAVWNCWFLFELYWSRLLRLDKFHCMKTIVNHTKGILFGKIQPAGLDFETYRKNTERTFFCFDFGSLESGSSLTKNLVLLRPYFMTTCLTILLRRTFHEALPGVTFFEMI